jgi:hypothetical protein
MSMHRRVGKTGRVDTITYKRIEPDGFVLQRIEERNGGVSVRQVSVLLPLAD